MQNKITNLKEHCIMFYLIFEAAASDSAIYLSSHAGKTNLLMRSILIWMTTKIISLTRMIWNS